jgi:Protein of unknown function (DUF3237)
VRIASLATCRRSDHAAFPTPRLTLVYTFRTSTQIETAAPDLDRLNKGVFISVGGRQAAGVIYETYLVD